VFAGLMFAAPWIDRRGPSPPVQPPSRVEVAVAVPDLPVPTTGADATTADAAPALADTVEVPPPSETAPPAPARFVRSVNIAPTPLPLPSSSSAAAFSNVSPPVVPAAELRFDPPPPAALSPSANVSRELAAAPLPAPHPPPAALEPAAAAAIVPPRADDEQLVKDVLQRYRAAYDELDARRARAVWPGVNETALERAFQDLESQSLTFDACEVKLRGAAATATCRGTARYVPKVGSREPRVESRVWTFTLQKAGEAWQIQNARAER
jgi:hypothetical protein